MVRKHLAELVLGLACLLAVGLSPAGAGSCRAEILELTLEYPRASLDLDEREGWAEIRFPGCERTGRVGAPVLPLDAEQVILPRGMRATGAEARSLASVRIPCGPIRPAAAPAILGPVGIGGVPPERVRPDPAVYEGSALYPGEIALFRGNGRFGDLPVASCEIRPVQFDPGKSEIVLHTRILLRLEVTADSRVFDSPPRPLEFTRVARNMVARRTGGVENIPMETSTGRAASLDPGDYQYVIVTEDEQASAWQTYADWKTAKGLPASVSTVEWIDAEYSGRDLPEKIRNFIIDAVDQWGTCYVLLGGDDQIVPSRIAWAFDCEAGFYDDENDIRADLYYSDLDGTWDANGNDVFGEVDDEIDLYPDVFVGRAPTDHLSDAQNVVGKFLTYERAPPAGHSMDAFFFAEILWADPYTDSGIGKDMIGSEHFGAYEPIERQYESLGNETVASVKSALNAGPHLANHGGHANYAVLGCGDNYLYPAGVDALVNGPRYFVLYSIGCWSAAIDYDCIGEHFLTNGNGGAVAYVGNSRYGWGSPGNPGWGYSETFDSDFYGAILSEGITQFGPAVARAKILRIPYAQDENVYRVHEYQVNLLGDPEMTCHTAEIRTITLDAPATIPLGTTRMTATVTDDDGPVGGARLCLAGPDVYQVGFSDASGQVAFSLNLSGAKVLTLTATAANHVYAQATVTAAGSDAFLEIVGSVFDDDGTLPSAGDGDTRIEAGETVELYVTVHNYGGSGASGVAGTLSESSTWVTVVESLSTFGTILAGGESTGEEPFVFEVLPGCPDDERIDFKIVFEDGGSGSWTRALPVQVLAPDPRFDHYEMSESIGDGDGVVDPGETIEITVYVRNEGSGPLEPLTAALGTTDSNVTILEGSASMGAGLLPGETAPLSPPFEVRVEVSCPETTVVPLDLTFVYDGETDDGVFLLAVGESGLEDNMESGAGGWTHAGVNDLWHLSDERAHSGIWSWTCGTAVPRYANDTDASLFSPEFVLPDDAQMSFWCYFDVTVYGVDGLFVEIYAEGAWNRLDYLGSGGALDSTLFVCGWAERTYDLSEFTPGSPARLRFWLRTDGSDTAEGFYIDDVTVRSQRLAEVLEPAAAAGMPAVAALRPLSCNPMGRESSWALSLPRSAQVTAAVYDIRGRRVWTLVDRFLPDGEHAVCWDGRTDAGSLAPAGVYFLRFRAAELDITRKIIRVR